MTFANSPTLLNRCRRTWPFRRRNATAAVAVKECAHGKSDHEADIAAELHSTRRESLGSLLMTDSSRTVPISEQQLASDPAVTNNEISVSASSYKTCFADEAQHDCPICCDSFASSELKQMPCCAMKLCPSCLLTHTMMNIHNGKVRIECPTCSAEINAATILANSEISVSLRERYQQILAQDLSDKHQSCIRLCPHCNYITIIDEHSSSKYGKSSRRAPGRWLRCDQCAKEWCWTCYAPSHPNETCRQFQKSHTHLDRWARAHQSSRGNQRNARRCPKCSVYIEKAGGCDHMVCTKCESRFCYQCGSRMRLPICIGHDAKYSVFGCKYKLWPNHPLLRWLVRGTILGGVVVLTPVVISTLIALLAIGIPIVLIMGCLAVPAFVCSAFRDEP